MKQTRGGKPPPCNRTLDTTYSVFIFPHHRRSSPQRPRLSGYPRPSRQTWSLPEITSIEPMHKHSAYFARIEVTQYHVDAFLSPVNCCCIGNIIDFVHTIQFFLHQYPRNVIRRFSPQFFFAFRSSICRMIR